MNKFLTYLTCQFQGIYSTSMLLFIIPIICVFYLLPASIENSWNPAESLTFYASFDEGISADIATGDPNLYMAPSLNRLSEMNRFTDELTGFVDPENNQDVRIAEGAGRYKNALHIQLPYSPILFFKGENNINYNKKNWEGTISFWMKSDPSQLASGYSDPIQITSRGWNDGAIFVDFTDRDPRIFRFAIFPDREVWDPQERDWDDVPPEDRPMVDVPDHPFTSDAWVHVAIVYKNFNTGSTDGTVDFYLNGQHFGSLTSREQTFTWDPEKVVIWLGYNFRGYFDELAIFDRVLSSNEIFRIYSLENGLSELIAEQ